MANPEHVKIVKQGDKAVDIWREENPGSIFDLSMVSFRNADFSGFEFNRVDFSGANLRRANLSGAYLVEANLSGANLFGANLSSANLSKADLRLADLSKADLSWANLVAANLRKAVLSNANLNEVNLRKANLRETKLIKTNFSNANLSEIDINRASTVGTLWTELDLSLVIGLDSIIHVGPSSLGVDTLMKSNGQIPEVFLRGCGLSDDFITYIPSHFTSTAIDFYSCFISYSHEDKSFARKLHDALQGRGIRCWLDEHQILPGDNIYDRIDYGIRVWDKVLLCASKHSLTSGWVDDEIKHAFAKEKQLFKQRGHEVLSLIPLNLDGHLFSEWKHPKRNQIHERLAADFTDWESDNAKFEEQFERVVKALQTNNSGREPDPIPKL